MAGTGNQFSKYGQIGDVTNMILVMLSGGLDSTGALVKVLQETDEPIHVHHVVIRNMERRGQVEQIACSKIIKYCREKYRSFCYTENVFEFLAFNKFFCWDNDVVRFIAAQIVKNDPSFDKVALGKCADDDSSVAFQLRAVQAHAIWRSCFFDYQGRLPIITRPVEHMTKKQISEYLPKELFNMTWSCRTPKQTGEAWLRCQTCDTCQKMQAAGIYPEDQDENSPSV